MCTVLYVTDGETRSRTLQAGEDTDRALHAFDLVEAWFFSDPMRELLEAIREQPPTSSSPERGAPGINGWHHQSEELPEWLDLVIADRATTLNGLTDVQVDVLRRIVAIEQTASTDFNFRAQEGEQYRERAEADVADFDAGLREQIAVLADRLGLVSPRPPQSRKYDVTLIMGGGYRSPLLRARYAGLLQRSGVDLGKLFFLGSPRFVEKPAERLVVEEYAPGAADEFDLMIAAAEAEFGTVPGAVTFLCGCPSAEAVCPAWPFGDPGRMPPQFMHERNVRLLDGAGRVTGTVLSAATSRPPLRPDTSDTFALWARQSDPRPGQRVLAVTTQVFVPFQAFDGLRMAYLPYGVDIDVVGFGADWGDRPETAEYLLQETLSAIRSGRRLMTAAAEVLMRHA